MTRLIRWLLPIAFRRGVLQGSRPWLVAGGAALLIRLFKRAAAREESLVYREQLLPGQTLTIAHQRRA
jgi:hypothetical protein